MRIVSEALLRGSNFFSPKLFITTKMDMWNEDLCLMQCGPSGIVWEWKIALGSWLLSNLKKQMILLPMIFYLKFRRKLNFGSYFKQWIRTFYTDISSRVMNNGFSYKLSFVQSIGFFKVILSYLSFLSWAWKFLRVKNTIWKEQKFTCIRWWYDQFFKYMRALMCGCLRV